MFRVPRGASLGIWHGIAALRQQHNGEGGRFACLLALTAWGDGGAKEGAVSVVWVVLVEVEACVVEGALCASLHTSSHRPQLGVACLARVRPNRRRVASKGEGEQEVTCQRIGVGSAARWQLRPRRQG